MGYSKNYWYGWDKERLRAPLQRLPDPGSSDAFSQRPVSHYLWMFSIFRRNYERRLVITMETKQYQLLIEFRPEVYQGLVVRLAGITK